MNSSFANEEFYHIYNRGVDKREIFLDDFDYVRFLKSMREFNVIKPIGSLYEKNFRDREAAPGVRPPIGGRTPKSHSSSNLVQIIAYCLNPNHYHIILKQNRDGGISEFMKRVGGGYTGYFNKKYKRSGSLFQGRFKAIHIDSNEYLLYLSAYVNKNNFIHQYQNKDDWKYSSWLDYVGKRNGNLCKKELILNQFKNKKEYQEFVDKTSLYLKDKKEMEKYLLE